MEDGTPSGAGRERANQSINQSSGAPQSSSADRMIAPPWHLHAWSPSPGAAPCAPSARASGIPASPGRCAAVGGGVHPVDGGVSPGAVARAHRSSRVEVRIAAAASYLRRLGASAAAGPGRGWRPPGRGPLHRAAQSGRPVCACRPLLYLFASRLARIDARCASPSLWHPVAPSSPSPRRSCPPRVYASREQGRQGAPAAGLVWVLEKYEHSELFYVFA